MPALIVLLLVSIFVCGLAAGHWIVEDDLATHGNVSHALEIFIISLFIAIASGVGLVFTWGHH